jgi:hypothetical protein
VLAAGDNAAVHPASPTGSLHAPSHYHRQLENPVDWSPFVTLAQRFDAPFFTMDIAQADIGNWIVVDMGAGECSSLPPSLEPTRFYTTLLEVMGTAPAATVPPMK